MLVDRPVSKRWRDASGCGQVGELVLLLCRDNTRIAAGRKRENAAKPRDETVERRQDMVTESSNDLTAKRKTGTTQFLLQTAKRFFLPWARDVQHLLFSWVAEDTDGGPRKRALTCFYPSQQKRSSLD